MDLSHKAYEELEDECGFKCTACGAVKFVASKSDMANEDRVFMDCRSCQSEEVEMEVIDLSEVSAKKKFTHNLRAFVFDESEDLTGLPRADAVDALREVADDLETHEF